MTDSTPTSVGVLTESVNAPGKTVEGNRADEMSDNERWDKMNRALLAYYDECVERGTVSNLRDAYDMDTHFLLKRMYCPKPIKQRNRHPLGAREFTLTYGRGWFASDDEARIEMKKAVDKLIKYYGSSITRLRAVGETGSKGQSHVHCFYKLQGGLKMTDKNFKRAWPRWNPSVKHGDGFEGGHHAEVKNEADFLGYIDKDINTAWLDINYPVINHTNADPNNDA